MPYIPSMPEVSFVSQSRGALSCAPGLWRGLAGLWLPNAGVQGSTLFDWSGYANHGTLTNMFPEDDWVTSRYGYALDFGGGNDWVSTAHSFDTSEPFSIAVWAQGKPTTGVLFGQHVNNRSYVGLLNGDYFFGAGDSYTQAGPASEVPASGWWHCAMVADGSINRMYVDGEEVASHGYAGIGPQNTGNAIGMRRDFREFWDGQITMVAAWNGRALTPAEIRQLYTDPHCMTRLDRSRLGVFRAAAAAQNRRLLKRILASELYVGGAL
jgi:hypothetical protein